MLRFPNPGSTIDNFVCIFGACFESLNGQVVTIDNLVKASIEANLATSSGYMGKEALKRSTRQDRSRDPLYNQLKMYAELFRILGWLHPTPQNALNFTFTLLGQQIVAAGRNYKPLLEECALGIAYPTPLLSIKGDFNLRPFAFILRVMAASDGHLSRDEMIIGPLSATSDLCNKNLDTVVTKIKEARSSAQSTKNLIDSVSKARNIQPNTLANYTRWPIALLRDLGWVNQGRAYYLDGKQYRTFHLTEKGTSLAERVKVAIDLRTSDVDNLAVKERNALSIVTHYRMMERSGFDISTVNEKLENAENELYSLLLELNATSSDDVLFSPFQSLSLENIDAAFPTLGEKPKSQRPTHNVIKNESMIGRDGRSHLFLHPNTVSSELAGICGPAALRAELTALLSKHKTIEDAADAFTAQHSADTQKEFYPLVTHLFQILGFESDYSRAGVNYQRWDAYVKVNGSTLPIEIKSPTEETVLSTKAIRQSLENKVILLSRGGLETNREFASLIVGNRLPNERGEMSNLIDDVFKAYSLRLGVIDLTSLSRLALRAVRDRKTIEATQLCKLRGFLDA